MKGQEHPRQRADKRKGGRNTRQVRQENETQGEGKKRGAKQRGGERERGEWK